MVSKTDAEFRYGLLRVGERPELYLDEVKLETAMAFVCGWDFANGGLALDNFQEWLVRTKFKRRQSFAWPVLIRSILASPSSTDQTEVEAFFSILEEYFDDQGYRR